jgi:Subtilase family
MLTHYVLASFQLTIASIVGGKRWGVAKDVELVSVRVFDGAGASTWASFAAGVDYCVAQQRNATESIIVNMSMGGPVNPTFDAAISVLLAEGAIVVAAAGNQNALSCSRSPPNALGVIGVGNAALTDTRDLASNYGACVDIWAPGVNVKAASSVCDSKDYCWKTLTGTSMASGLVSGSYALYLESKRVPSQASAAASNTTTRSAMAQEIRQQLLADATAIPTLGVLGSADRLLCLEPLNNGTSVAAPVVTSAPASSPNNGTSVSAAPAPAPPATAPATTTPSNNNNGTTVAAPVVTSAPAPPVVAPATTTPSTNNGTSASPVPAPAPPATTPAATTPSTGPGTALNNGTSSSPVPVPAPAPPATTPAATTPSTGLGMESTEAVDDEPKNSKKAADDADKNKPGEKKKRFKGEK